MSNLKPILAAVRKEVVVIAGLATSVLTFLVANQSVIATIIPLVVSLAVRTQVSPVSKLEELLRLIAELRTKAASARVAELKVKAAAATKAAARKSGK